MIVRDVTYNEIMHTASLRSIDILMDKIKIK